MSNCQYSLMGKHWASPKGQTVYRIALIKMQPEQLVSLDFTNTQTLAGLTQSGWNHYIHAFCECSRLMGKLEYFSFSNYIFLIILFQNSIMIQHV